jgi:hypothetical protein
LIRFPDSSPPGVGANVKVWASGGLAWAGRIVTPTQPMVEMGSEPFEEGLATQITLERTGGAHPFPEPLRVEGTWFATTQGQPWSMIGCSDFALLANKLHGQDIQPVLEQRATLGFNTLRVFAMCLNYEPGGTMFDLVPSHYPNYWDVYRQVADEVHGWGMRIEFTVFAAASRAMPDPNERRAFWQACCDHVGDLELLDLVNENDQADNHIDISQFQRPPRIASRGSNGADSWPVEPAWDWAPLHPSRPTDWPRKSAHNPMEDIAERLHIPSCCDEQARPDQGRGPIPQDHYDAAAGSMLLHNGTVFHSQAGKQSRLFTEPELSCAKASAMGAAAVPIRYRGGMYTAGHLSECPIAFSDQTSSRTYARIIGNESCAVVIQPTPSFVAQAIRGWRIVKQSGLEQGGTVPYTVFELVR